MKVLFRADASVEIGTGHVVRCVTLASVLTDLGAEVAFACRELPGHLNQWLSAQGYRVFGWSADSPAFLPEALQREIQAFGFDWLVVDHYGLDALWETSVGALARYRLVVDDLANRPHGCDLLLDQNFFGSGEARYDGLLPADCRLLLGPAYALLRPEFSENRAAILTAGRRTSGPVRRVQIFFGGSDPTGETQRALQALSSPVFSDLKLDVIVGASNPEKAAIEKACLALPNTAFHCQTNQMASLMGEADLAIGAGGTATWERLCVGLPAVVIAVADNQEQISREVAGVGAQLYLGRSGEVSPDSLAGAVQRLLDDPTRLAELSAVALSLVDGLGAIRVAEAMRERMSCPPG